MRRRLVLLIIIAIIILAGAAAALYFATQKQNEIVAQEQTPTLKIQKVVDEVVVSPVAGFDNNSIWYFNSEGQLFNVRLSNGNLSEFPLPPLSQDTLRSVVWPKEGPDFIALTGTPADVQKKYYDSNAKVYVNLAKNIQDLDWLPDGKRIVYIWKGEGNQQLVTANADGTGYKNVADVFWADLNVEASPDGKTVLLYRSPATEPNKIYAANLETGMVVTVVDQGKNIAAKWIASDKFLYATDTNVFLYDVTNKQVTDLRMITSLDQIAANTTGKVLYANVNGEFRKIDLDTNKSEVYFKPQTNIQAKTLFLVGSEIYYVDKVDNNLYTISK